MKQQLGITGAEGTSFGAHELLNAFGGSIGWFTDAAKNGGLDICRLHGMQYALDRLGIDVIVGVHKKDGLALGGIDTGISSTRDARVFLVNHQYAIVCLRDLVQHVRRIISRTVVDADNLNRALGLGQQRIEASLNGARRVVNGDDNGSFGGQSLSHANLPPQRFDEEGGDHAWASNRGVILSTPQGTIRRKTRMLVNPALRIF